MQFFLILPEVSEMLQCSGIELNIGKFRLNYSMALLENILTDFTKQNSDFALLEMVLYQNTRCECRCCFLAFLPWEGV